MERRPSYAWSAQSNLHSDIADRLCGAVVCDIAIHGMRCYRDRPAGEEESVAYRRGLGGSEPPFGFAENP